MTTIIEFAPRGDHTADGWRRCEFDRFIETFAAERDRGQVERLGHRHDRVGRSAVLPHRAAARS